jgi:S-layer protein
MAVGVSDLSIQIGQAASNTEAATGGIAIGGNTTIAATTVALSSLGSNALANSMVLLNADNSTYTITGSNDLTLTGIQATAIGSKFDGTAATGKLNITGNATGFSAGTTLGDILIGGTAADTLKASVNGGTLTGNAGNDTFNVSVALGGTSATFQTTTITDFTKGDIITFGGTAGAFSSAKVDLSGAATFGAALNLLAAGSNTDLKWGQWGGNTYIVDDLNAAATFSADDTFVKLTGTLDLSTSTFAGNSLTFA